MDLLIKFAVPVPRYEPLAVYPAVSRDLNLQLDQSVAWAELEQWCGPKPARCSSRLEYRDTYRDPQRVPPGKKRILFSFSLRDPQGTLTGALADELRDRIARPVPAGWGRRCRASRRDCSPSPCRGWHLPGEREAHALRHQESGPR